MDFSQNETAPGPMGISIPYSDAHLSHTPASALSTEAALRAEIERLRASQRELEDRQMVETTLAHLAKLLRWEVGLGVQPWSERWLAELATTLQAAQASVYFCYNDSDDCLTLCGTYAAPEGISPRIELGNGIVGQCARDGRTFYLDDVSVIRSAGRTSLVEIVVQAILVQPLMHNGKVVGVLDLGLVQPPKPAHRTLVNRLCEQVAAQWVSIRSQVQVERLLAEAHERSEQLAAQEEELRQNLEEMQASEEELRQQTEELNATQEEMRRRELELQASLAAIDQTVATIEFAMNGIVLGANSQFLSTMGYTLEEVKGMPHSLFLLDAEAAPAAYNAFWDKLRAGQSHNGEFCRRAKDGQLVWLRATYTPVLGIDGKPVRVMKLALNVTETRKLQEGQQQAFEEMQASEEELRQQTEELQATQEEMRRRELELQATLTAIDSTLATIEFAMDGTVLRANRLFLDTVGYTAEEVVGQPHSQFLEPADADPVAYNAFWDRLRAGLPHNGEFRRRGKGGRLVWLRATYTPVLGTDGKPARVMKLALDVTAQKAAAQEHRAHLEAIQRSTATVEFDMQGNVLWANDKFLNLMGCSLDAVRGKPHAQFVLPHEQDSRAYAEFWERLRKGEFQSGEFQRVACDGREVWIRGSYNPVPGPDGKPAKVVKIAIDTTEQHRQQAALQQAFEELQAGEEELRQQAEELNATHEEMRRREVELQATMAAIHRTLATIEFGMDGSILAANARFAELMGYEPSQLVGKPHRKLMPKGEAEKPEYEAFWQALRKGQAQEGSFVRLAANGKRVQVQATYTPILDAQGQPYKVLKLIQRLDAA